MQKPDQNEVGEAIDLVRAYVIQETVGPLRGFGRRLGLGFAGALTLGLGLFFLSLGLLRLIQTHVHRLASGSLSWIAYLIVFFFAAGIAALAVWRVRKIEKELS